MSDFFDMTGKLNTLLQEKYRSYRLLDRAVLRKELEHVGSLQKLAPLPKEELEEYFHKICAVDGSNNRIGGNFPHYVDVFRGCCIRDLKDGIFVENFLTPLLDEIAREEEITRQKKMLAQVEVEAALQALEKYTPKVYMMDGSLIRYEISVPELWETFRKKTLEQNILVVGVIEDIKTNHLAKQIPLVDSFLYDREIMFHVLEYREVLLLQQTDYGKSKYDYSSAFLRASADPLTIGLDMFSEQKQYLKWMSRFVLSLTDEHSRGVPVLIDLVDGACKVKKEVLEQMMKRSLSRDLYEIFFHATRSKRSRLYE